MKISPKIFKAYDIRGVYPEEINEKATYKIGRAFIKFLKPKKIALGYDMRESSLSLLKEIIKAATDEGCNILDIGLCTRPMLGFAVAYLNLDGGIMISASHSPKEYNGLKLLGKGGLQISEDSGIKEIQKIVNFDLKSDLKKEIKSKIVVNKKDILPDYLAHVFKFTKEIKDLKVVLDYGNGMGALSAKPIFDNLPIKAIHLFPKPNGNFPNHSTNPHNLANFKDLQKKVLEEKADLGVFFDGDADRSILVDEKGEIIEPDLELAILAKEVLKKHPKEKIYYDLRFSKAVSEAITNYGGIPIMLRVGNPFYKEKLANEGGILAGELSGHIMYKENYILDDGLFAAVKIMDILSKTGKKLSELVKPLQKYFQTEEINIEVKDKDKVLKKVQEKFQDGKNIKLDGIYIEYPDWWFNLRESNTDAKPIIRLRIEANSQKLLEKKRKEILEIIKN